MQTAKLPLSRERGISGRYDALRPAQTRPAVMHQGRVTIRRRLPGITSPDYLLEKSRLRPSRLDLWLGQLPAAPDKIPPAPQMVIAAPTPSPAPKESKGVVAAAFKAAKGFFDPDDYPSPPASLGGRVQENERYWRDYAPC